MVENDDQDEVLLYLASNSHFVWGNFLLYRMRETKE